MQTFRNNTSSDQKPKGRIVKKEELDRQDRTRFQMILLRGFGVASGYDLNRNRYEIELKEGVTETELYNFCSRHLKGYPFPSPDPMSGSCMLDMFKAAEKAGLVTLNHIKADQFVPEAGCIR